MRRLVPLVAALIALAWLAPATFRRRRDHERSLVGGRQCPGRSVVGHRGRCGQRWTGHQRRASPGQRSGRLVVVRRPGRPADRLTQALRALRAALDLRPRPRRDARLRRAIDRQGRRADHGSRSISIGHRRGGRRARPARGRPEQRVGRSAGRGAARSCPWQPEDLPARVEAWSAIDRLVWQDVDTAKLQPEQLSALRTWLGLGGRLVDPRRLDGRHDARQPAGRPPALPADGHRRCHAAGGRRPDQRQLGPRARRARAGRHAHRGLRHRSRRRQRHRR